MCWLLSLGAGAQTPAPDLIRIKVPQLKYSVPDSVLHAPDSPVEVFAEEDVAAVPSLSFFFRPQRPLELVSEDTTSLDEGAIHLIEISEELQIDCVWVKLTEYYAIWDSRRINPYDADMSRFRDTVTIALVDTLAGRGWSLPLDDMQVTSAFGMRRYRWHYGADFRLQIGDTIRAAFDGIVRIRSYDPRGYGNYILLRHYNGLETLYGHMSKLLVDVGQEVRAGDPIGLGGNTGRSSGPHLHYEVRYQGSALNPADIYDFQERKLHAQDFTVTAARFQYVSSARKVAYHSIRSGDTLSGISRRYGISISTLCRLNGISTRTTLRVGQRLRIR